MPSGDWRRLHLCREEARELWPHLVTDEVVYFLENTGVQLSGAARHDHLETYRRGETWLEFFLRLSGGGIDGDYAAICEVDPQRIPSVIRLQRFDDLTSIWFDVGRKSFEVPGVGTLEDWERSLPLGFAGHLLGPQVRDSQGERDVIKRTSHVVNSITNDQAPRDDRGRSERGVDKFW